MQPFMKMKKKVGMTESTRQVLNRTIDLLHRVSNKKLSEEVARRELSTTLSTHFFAEGGGEEQRKIKLQLVLEEANGIITQLEKEKIPLYEAIMLINRIVVSGVKEEDLPVEPVQLRTKMPQYEEEVEFVSQEFDVSGERVENNLHVRAPQKVVEKPLPMESKQPTEEVAVLMNRVLTNKKQLEDSVQALNGLLQIAGFELRPIGK